ncbi:hypothetical protein BTVI_101793 [Pitangus sulphuratus]|nr:hypothetical protein BTVI_101793 [Pitangus sulphuratus]
MPAGSRMGFLPLAKAKPIRSDGNTSVIAYLRTEGCGTERIPAKEEQSENREETARSSHMTPLVQQDPEARQDES